MFSPKEFKEKLDAVSAIKIITNIYQEIAALKTKELREGVARTREFLDGVSEIYNHAKAAYVGEMQRSMSRSKKKDLTKLKFIRRNGKSVLVFLSANEHLYGNLVLNVWERFINDYRKTKNDAVIVGTFGRYLMRDEEIKGTKVEYFSMDDEKPRPEEIKKVLDYISKYAQIYVYYGQLVSILNQITAVEQISGGINFEQKISAKSYLFEPSPDKIMEFFETEIIAAIFSQKVYEHQLARFAARMVAMDQATENAKEVLKTLDREFKALTKRERNRKQLEIFAGYNLWLQEENK